MPTMLQLAKVITEGEHPTAILAVMASGVAAAAGRGSPRARTAFCATLMSVSCDNRLSVSTAFKLGLLTFRRARVKGTACLQPQNQYTQVTTGSLTSHPSFPTGTFLYDRRCPAEQQRSKQAENKAQSWTQHCLLPQLLHK